MNLASGEKDEEQGEGGRGGEARRGEARPLFQNGRKARGGKKKRREAVSPVI